MHTPALGLERKRWLAPKLSACCDLQTVERVCIMGTGDMGDAAKTHLYPLRMAARR